MKPLDLKIGWLRERGFGVEQRGELLYIYAQIVRQRAFWWRVCILHGNPSYRRIRESLHAHFRRSGAG